MSIGNYQYRQLLSGAWEARRGDFIMAIFGTREEARDYCQRKHNEEQE